MTTHPGTPCGTDGTPADGTVIAFAPGTGRLWVPVVSTPDGTNGTILNGTTRGTGHGTAGQNGSPVPAVPARRSLASIILGDRNRGTGEPENRGTVTTVTTESAAPPAPTQPDKPARKLRLSGHGHQARTWLTIVVAVVASLGQAQYARAHNFIHMIELPTVTRVWNTGYNLGGVDVTPWLAVAVFDLAVAALLYSGRVAFKTMGLSPWPFWGAAAGVAGFSVWTNTQHVGGWVTAPASAVLFLIWFLTLLYEYLAWRRDEGHRADATPNLLASRLLIIDRRLAVRAWIIASTRPLSRGVTHRQSLGEDITPRELAIQVARLYLDVLDDQVVSQLGAGQDDKDGQKPKRIRFWQRRLRKAALGRAVMTASDAVDHYLGLPVIERSGIKPARISYAAPVEDRVPAPVVHRVERPAAPAQRTERVPGTALPVSAPPAPPVAAKSTPAPQRTTPAPTVAEDVLEAYADKIALVQARAGDAWWNGPRALTVDQVQKEFGVGNRGHASTVARCLAFLRAQKLDDVESTSPAPHTNAPQGGTE